ncbi:MFS transporter [Bradyrhizobium sp. AS23.2]|uniref:MFS transporter n=1 Tax=Bradyrhizobium sp. AS23.2 TaxID=1680155 RepID=UPI000938AAEF|nr:MFS transporter [Bradyrhizobium sp. AS23.2]OKO84655.1 MFS transporter [Bradyrhizobium sp. AS23.2]
MQDARHTAAARLDRLPLTNFHRRLFGLVAGGLFTDNFDIYVAGAVLGQLLAIGFSDLAQNATFVSATFAGMLIGTIGSGIIADRYGRRLTFQFNLAVFGVATLACAAAPDIFYLTIFRFVAGVGLGAELTVGYSTLSEFTPPARRGRWQALLSMMSSFGLLASTMMSWALIPVFGWRVMFVVPGVCALGLLLLRKSLPESPRWLEAHNRFDEADRIVAAIERKVIEEGGELQAPATTQAAKGESLWQAKLVRPLVLGTILQVAMFAALYGLVNWIPSFLLKQGMPINQSLGLSALMSLGGPVGAFVAFAIIDRIGRRPAVVVGSVLAAALSVLFGQATSQVGAVICGFVLFSLVYFLLATIQAVYLPELFPTAVRVRCNAICIGIARLTTLVTPFLIVSVFNAYGISGVVTAIAALLVVQAASMALLGRETRGIPLEQIFQEPSTEPQLKATTVVS